MTTDRWGAVFICTGICLFSVAIGIKFGVLGVAIAMGTVLTIIGMAILIP